LIYDDNKYSKISYNTIDVDVQENLTPLAFLVLHGLVLLASLVLLAGLADLGRTEFAFLRLVSGLLEALVLLGRLVLFERDIASTLVLEEILLGETAAGFVSNTAVHLNARALKHRVRLSALVNIEALGVLHHLFSHYNFKREKNIM
tara:strand:+ start:3817 stop:4257 length:441 start_codon:yes stop_codon:yes gene_type:complete